MKARPVHGDYYWLNWYTIMRFDAGPPAMWRRVPTWRGWLVRLLAEVYGQTADQSAPRMFVRGKPTTTANR